MRFVPARSSRQYQVSEEWYLSNLLPCVEEELEERASNPDAGSALGLKMQKERSTPEVYLFPNSELRRRARH